MSADLVVLARRQPDVHAVIDGITALGEPVQIRGGSLITLAIITGDLPFSGAGAESVVAARAAGGDIILLACPVDADPVYLITRPEIKSPQELKGLASAVTRYGSTTHFYLRAALKHVGLNPDKDMTILQLGAGPEMVIALERGAIAAALTAILLAFLKWTLVGTAVRALMQDPIGVRLMGVRITRLHAVSVGVGVGLAFAFLAAMWIYLATSGAILFAILGAINLFWPTRLGRAHLWTWYVLCVLHMAADVAAMLLTSRAGELSKLRSFFAVPLALALGAGSRHVAHARPVARREAEADAQHAARPHRRVGAHMRGGKRCHAAPLAHAVHRGREVGSGVGEGAVEVEQHRTASHEGSAAGS